jgi:hypothetical protein
MEAPRKTTRKVALVAFSLFAPVAYAQDGYHAVTMRELNACTRTKFDEHGEIGTPSREGADLIVEIKSVATCHQTPNRPQALVAGSSIELFWLWDARVLAECLCTYHLEFRVHDLPAGDFTVKAPLRWW